MKKYILAFITAVLFFSMFATSILAAIPINNEAEFTSQDSSDFNLNANSAILMEATTGKILYSNNENDASSPASVTKIMTLLLTVEAITEERIRLDDKVCISDYAASMGGSQVFLEEGEIMSVEELLKCAIIASANDAAVALAEHVSGNENAFVNLMNKRANELGMKNTNFENATGLDDTTVNHVTSAKDIAIMSRELIKFDIIKKYSSLWQDSIRNGEFVLTNTNRLVRYYDGCNGLKTGSTDKAGFCISATAERAGMQLIAVIMGAPTRDARNAAAKALLDYGFSNYALFKSEEKEIESVEIHGGNKDCAKVYSSEFSCVVPKGSIKKIEMIFDIPEVLGAPIKAGEKIGSIQYKIGDEFIGESALYLKEDISQIHFFDVFLRILKNILQIDC